MSYVFTKTERNNLKASVFETKSLLFLAAKNSKYNHITVLSIDCFNDVSGMCENEDLWDIQAKNEKSLTPRKIGKYLITLFENYQSKFHPYFQEYIFFMPPVKTEYIIDSSLSMYAVSNFKKTHKSRLIDGLKAATVLDDDTEFEKFFDKLLFVEDRSDEASYVKNIMHFKTSKNGSREFYESIFNEIRDKQTGLKNSEIEGMRINRPKDVLSLNRSLSTEQLQVFVLNRFVGLDVFKSNGYCPSGYIRFTRDINEDELEDHIFEQNESISKAFFYKNNQKHFWKLFSEIFKVISNNPDITISKLVGSLPNGLVDRVEHINDSSAKFLAAMIKEGLIT